MEMEGNNMVIYGYVRHSPLKKERPAEGQIAEMARKAEELGDSLTGVFVDPRSTDSKTGLLSHPTGKEILEVIQAGDTLIVVRMEHLGYTMRDIHKTVDVLADRRVRIYVLRASNRELDLQPKLAKTVLTLFDVWGQTERALRSERAANLACLRKEKGLAYGGVPTAKKIVERNGSKVLEWDMEQLGYIAEIAKRLPIEGPEKVAKDFWKRRIKDRRGRLWGKQTPRPKSQSLTIFERLVRGGPPHRTPYKQFCRAAQWFHRMKRKGLLPPPYGELAMSMQEPKGFREEPKPKKWTRGGTARREQERAALKAQRRADRLARWQAEKAARIQSRVRKPKVELQLQGEGTEPWTQTSHPCAILASPGTRGSGLPSSGTRGET
jgi:DNA invertase Pin-like site-specific DNA recombinase